MLYCLQNGKNIGRNNKKSTGLRTESGGDFKVISGILKGGSCELRCQQEWCCEKTNHQCTLFDLQKQREYFWGKIMKAERRLIDRKIAKGEKSKQKQNRGRERRKRKKC